MSKTTAECKEFLVKFIHDTPGIIKNLFGGAEGDEAFNDALVEKNWKRKGKWNAHPELEYDVMTRGAEYQRGPHYHKGIPLSGEVMATVREFYLLTSKYDSQVGFWVLEAKDGTLYVGEYIGD